MASPKELEDPAAFRDFCDHQDKGLKVEYIQTHLSMVFLVGEYAFKVKKAVTLGPPFADQSTLEQREKLCRGELVKNQEWNSSLYVNVYPIVREEGEGKLRVLKDSKDGSARQVVDYALCMKRFDTCNRLDKLLDSNKPVDTTLLAAFGSKLALLQHKAKRIIASDGTQYAVTLREVLLGNIDQLESTKLGKRDAGAIDRLKDWLRSSLDASQDLLRSRAENGYVRELHGDLHSKNIFQGKEGFLEMFDCLEFNDDLAQIDLANDVAFLFMDLYKRNRQDLAWVFVDAWLETSGDLESIQLLRLFAAYRAVVRCKIAALQAEQQDLNVTHDDEYLSYLRLAQELVAKDCSAGVVVMMGKSGSGKSYWGAQLAKEIGAVRVKSDVERKRLFGGSEDKLVPLPGENAAASNGALSPSKKAKGMYSDVVSDETYDRLICAGRAGIRGNQLVILDASYLSKSRRKALTEALHACKPNFKPLFVLCDADDSVLRERVRARKARGGDWSDADEAVLGKQVLDAFDEGEEVVTFRTDRSESEKIVALRDLAVQIRDRCAL